ncbi:MAG: DUF5132 domain-containing protein [Cyanobacteria bacterium SBLK]|nr:DUF5132 domain-containing protein [Cyanobacteria bacterium SBLK]
MLDRIRQMYRDNPTRAIAIGVGVLVVAPTVLPLLKPVAKATVKTGLSLYEKAKGTMAETGEAFGDLVAEAKAELAIEAREKATVEANLFAAQKSET